MSPPIVSEPAPAAPAGIPRKGKGIASLVMGICSLCLAWTGVTGLVCAILGLCFNKTARSSGNRSGVCKAGHCTSKTGLILSIIVTVCCLLFILGLLMLQLRTDYAIT